MRVPEIKVEARKSISPVMSRIVHRIKEITSRSQEFDLISRSMQALLSIASSSQSGEEPDLSETIPVVTQTVSKFPDLRPAIALISVLTFVPFFILLHNVKCDCLRQSLSIERNLDHEFCHTFDHLSPQVYLF